MNATPLAAQPRSSFGKGAARKLRASGKIPALIYSNGAEAAHIQLDPEQLRLIFRRSANPNTVLAIDVDGTVRNCLVKESLKHPVSRDLLHVDFYEVNPDKTVDVEVELRTTGKAVGVGMGGKLQQLVRTMKVRCLPKDIPAIIEVDVTPVGVNEFLRASQVNPPAGCKLTFTRDFNVVTVTGKRADESAEGDKK